MIGRSPPAPAGSGYVWLAANVFSLTLGVIVLALFAAAALTTPAALQLALLAAGIGLGLLVLRVAGQAPARQRIYRLLERRFAARGVVAEDLKRFLGEPCLIAQAILLLARWRRLDVLGEALRLAKGEGVLFLAHPVAPVEDELNFPQNTASVKNDG